MATWLIYKASWGKTEASGEVRKIQRRGQRSLFSTFNAKVSMKRQLAESRQYKLLLFNLNFSAHSLPLFIYTITMTEKQKVKGQLTKLNYNLGCRNKTVEDTKVTGNTGVPVTPSNANSSASKSQGGLNKSHAWLPISNCFVCTGCCTGWEFSFDGKYFSFLTVLELQGASKIPGWAGKNLW